MCDYLYEGLLYFLITLIHWLVILSMAEVWQGFNALSNNSFITTLIGALVGGIATYSGVWYQVKQQRKIDEQKSKNEEQNKLRYLLFLVEDMYKVVDHYDMAITLFENRVSQNIYYISDVPVYSSYSLESIVSKIDQEGYYLAARRLLRAPTFADKFFPMLNDLERSFRHIQTRYKNDIPLLNKGKIDFGEAADGIPGILMSYMNGPHTVYGLAPEVQSMYNDCIRIFIYHPDSVDIERLNQLDDGFLDRLQEHFRFVSIYEGVHWKQISQVIEKNKRYKELMIDFTLDISKKQSEMNDTVRSIRQNVTVLKQYVDSLPV